MFDGTDLALVYGDLQQDQNINSNEYNQNIKQPTQKHIKEVQVQPDIDYKVPEQIYQQPNRVLYKEPEINFFEKLGNTKGDVFKLFMFSLVILIAISFDKLIFFYLKKYLDENLLSSTNELIIRLSYPIGIIVLIWILKSL